MYVALSAVLEFGDTKMIDFALSLYIQHLFNKYSWCPVCVRWKKNNLLRPPKKLHKGINTSAGPWRVKRNLWGSGGGHSWMQKLEQFWHTEGEWEDTCAWVCSARVVGEGRGRLRATCEGPWFPAKEFRFYLLEGAYFAQGKGMSIFVFLRWSLTAVWRINLEQEN